MEYHYRMGNHMDFLVSHGQYHMSRGLSHGVTLSIPQCKGVHERSINKETSKFHHWLFLLHLYWNET